MYLSDTERVIPRQRINFVNLITEGLIFLFVIFFIGQLILGANRLGRLASFESAIFILFVGFIILSGFISLGVRWIQRRTWGAFAEEMGFQTEQKTVFSIPKIHGTYRGYRISITDSTEKQGRSTVHFTNFILELNTPSQNSFTIQKRSFTHFNRELTNDAGVDKKLTIKISSKKLLQQMLKTRRLRQGLLELGERARSKVLYLNGKTLHYKERNQISDREYIQAVLNYLIELAKLVEREEQIGF
ncbi:MAG: hypothetical protein P8Y68_06180 [Anaerolineales bacterium]|jgi:hypothetical protein